MSADRKRKHPIQYVEKDAGGVFRFRANAIVRHLLDAGPFDMNSLAEKDFSREDREQFAQLIGYSVSGASDLEYVSDETLAAAQSKLPALEAQNAHLREELFALRKALQKPMARLFGKHPDDLEVDR